ncbi:MAG: putative DNA binding domain-containing protein [Gammaproteobacteria bacterium]|nr:putative DNA binding domain-containing protein [Gammaproteobacteria bacterium]
MSAITDISLILSEGESYKVEFKEQKAKLDREIVAFANASGGSIYLGVNDQSEVVGIEISNKLMSEIHDIARNCDPSIRISLVQHKAKVLEVQVEEGIDKPYRCHDGFFLRVGPSAQKLRRDEIVELLNNSGKIRFDESINTKFDYKNDFSKNRLKEYLKICEVKTSAKTKDILQSFSVAEYKKNELKFTNACVLFFSLNPQRFFPESYITCVRYQSNDRFSIIDKAEILGSPIEQIEEAMLFILRNISVKTVVSSKIKPLIGQSTKVYDYPINALREAVVNAVTHRDYGYDSSHVYIHIYPDHIDIENPGGLYHGLTIDNLGKRSVRRNRLIADLLYRANYIEKAGTGFDRMHEALKNNNNPPLDVSVTNFFNIRFYKRVESENELNLTARQQLLYAMLKEKIVIKKQEAALYLGISNDTALRELKVLEKQKLIVRTGTGKSTAYRIKIS